MRSKNQPITIKALEKEIKIIMDQKGGMPTGRKLKAVSLGLPGEWQDFALWLVQVTKVKAEFGSDIAIEFVKESKRRYSMTEHEYKFALSLAE